MKFSIPLVLISSSLSAQISHASYVFTGLNTVIIENFDSLPSTSSANFLTSTVGTQVAVTGTGFDATKIAGNGTTSTSLVADDGNGVSGSIYSYGATGNAERALGALASASNTMGFGFQYVNDIGSATTVTTLQFDFIQETWKSSAGTLNTVLASYAPGSATVTSSNYLTSAGFTAIPEMNLVNPAGGTNVALDGNLSANQVVISYTLAGLNLAPGQSLFVRWRDANETGNDAGLAIDGLKISVVPEPSSLLLGMFGVMSLMRRRR